jgi:hypothetical protein
MQVSIDEHAAAKLAPAAAMQTKAVGAGGLHREQRARLAWPSLRLLVRHGRGYTRT